VAKNNVVLVVNELSGVFAGELSADVALMIDGQFPLNKLNEKFNPVFKNKYIDLVFLDRSCFLNDEELITFVQHLRSVSGDLRDKPLRVILLAPNLTNEETLHYLVTYQVFDILNPVINSTNQTEINNAIFSELILNLANPKTFSQVSGLIKPLTPMVSKEVAVKKGKAPKQEQEELPKKTLSHGSKIRAYAVYSEDEGKDHFPKKLSAFGKRARLDYVENKPITNIGDTLTNINQLFIDVLIMYRPTVEQMKEIIETVSTVDTQIEIAVFHTEYEAFEKISKYLSSKNPYAKIKAYFIHELNFTDIENAVINSRSTQYRIKQDDILRNKATVISVLGSKGGVGSTTVSSLLAKTFGGVDSLKVCVVDYSYYMGDLNAGLGIAVPDKNIFAWFKFVVDLYRQKASNIENQYETIFNYCERDKGNFYVLSTPNVNFFEYTHFDITDEEREQSLVYTLDALKAMFDVVILDVNSKYSNMDIALQNSTHIIMVTEPNITAIYRLKETIAFVFDIVNNQRLSSIFLVVNKDNSNSDSLQAKNLKDLKTMMKDLGINDDNIFRLAYDPTVIRSSNEMNVDTFDKKNRRTLIKLSNSILNVFRYTPMKKTLAKGKKNKSQRKGGFFKYLLLILMLFILSGGVVAGAYWFLYIR
jgi:cellulose biosynthesis protein BcsQ